MTDWVAARVKEILPSSAGLQDPDRLRPLLAAALAAAVELGRRDGDRKPAAFDPSETRQ